MPYTLAQLEFLGIHLGIVVPPELLEKKRKAEGSESEKPESGTQQSNESAKAEVSKKRKDLLDALSKLIDPPFAGAEALGELKSERETATAALSDESPTPEQFAAAEKAIAAFGAKVELEKKRVAEKRKGLLEALSKLIDPPFAGTEALGALKSERETATSALSAELPTPEQLDAAERAIAAFGEKAELEKKRITEKRKALLDEVAKLGEAPFAAGDVIGALNSDRETASGALSAEFPTTEQFQTAENAIAAFREKLEGEKKRVAEKRKGLLDAVSKLIDPPFAGAEALGPLNSDREAASGALSGEFPTPQQFEAAEQAIAAFNTKVENEKKRVGEKRKALLDEIPKLVDPPFAAPAALEELKKEREAATGALTAELPTAEQIKKAEDAIAAFAQKLETEKQRVTGRRTTLLQQAKGLTDPPFADADALKELKKQREAATAALSDEQPTPDQLKAAEDAIAEFAVEVDKEKQRVIAKKADLKKFVDDFSYPDGLEEDEEDEMEELCEKADDALKDEAPTPADLKKAEELIAALKRTSKKSSGMKTLAGKNQKQAKAARKAFKGFEKIIGNVDITPEVLANAEKKAKDSKKDCDDKLQIWNQLNVVPSGETPQAKLERETKLNQAGNEWLALEEERKKAEAYENAVLGHKLLTEALDHGPLSAESGQRLKAGSAKMVKAFTKNPRLASAAVNALATAKHPAAIVNGLDTILDKTAEGFKSGTGTHWTNPDYAREYGEKLLRMGGEVGGEFFDRLPDYIASGKHFDSNPLGPTPGTWAELAQKRSVTLANSMVNDDGSIDITSTKAKDTIGHLLFHPDAVKHQVPSMNTTLLKTLKFLGDPTTGPQATNVLKATVKPTDPGAQKLIRTALGKGDTEPVSDKETRTAVLASFLKPLNQGAVGSCFSTAPVRRMRETKPLNSLKAFSDIASKGTFKPEFGEEVPVVTNTPPGDDPIQRSLEYTLATSTARTGDSSEKTQLVNNIERGSDQFRAIAGGTDEEWANKKSKLKNDVKTAFTFIYDPLSKVTDANDGSSSTGRYVTKRVSSGKEIRTKDDFVAEMAEVAIASLGIDPSSDKATEIKDLVKQDSFVNAVCPDKYKPWELSSGGQTEAATKTLLGGTMQQHQILGPSPTVKPPEGQRTSAVLKSFLNGMSGRTEEMVTVRTVGRHGFNALPNHPSLSELKGSNPTETETKVQTNLINRGQTLKNTDLTAERSAWLFDQEMKKALGKESDPTLKAELEKGIKAKRPKAAMKPADVARAVKEASHEYHLLVAEKRANAWKLEEETAGRTVATDKLEEKKNKIKSAFDDQSENGAKSLMIRDMGAPQFVIADTNWGDCQNVTLFVIAPDPTTGEPLMWKKQEPPGSLSPAGREWVDDEWAHIS